VSEDHVGDATALLNVLRLACGMAPVSRRQGTIDNRIGPRRNLFTELTTPARLYRPPTNC
jgi:hypothetical protein